MLLGLPLLSLAIWVPVAFGILVLAIGDDRNPAPARWTALVGSALGLAVCIPLWTRFDPTPAMQFVEMTPWITHFNVNYHLGVDGISMPFILLNSLMTLLVVIAHWEVVTDKVSQYLAAFLVMSGLINGVFAALDAIVFYVFFEAMLIPMFLIIGIWGGPNRVYAAVKFFLYTLLGSLLMLAAFIYLYQQTALYPQIGPSFEILDFHKVPLTETAQKLIFLAMFMSFAVKVPMWPVHTWLPDAHVEAPTGGSVILAAITLKIGGYGFMRFNLPITPDASLYFDTFMITLSLIAVVYIGLVALVQSDMKKLIAYSSISHMGFVTLGLFGFTREGALGALLQMISHGFVSAAMFLCVGVLYDRVHSREISAYGGVANKMPVFAAFFVLFAMANSGLPATSGFVGEFMVLLGTIKVSFWYTFLAATTLIFGAAYTLWMVKRVIYGAVANDHVAALQDVKPREITFLAILAVAVLAMGLYPKPFSDVMNPSIQELLRHVAHSKIAP